MISTRSNFTILKFLLSNVLEIYLESGKNFKKNLIMQLHIFKVENLKAEIKSTLANVKEESKQTGLNYSNFLSHVGFNIHRCSV